MIIKTKHGWKVTYRTPEGIRSSKSFRDQEEMIKFQEEFGQRPRPRKQIDYEEAKQLFIELRKEILGIGYQRAFETLKSRGKMVSSKDMQKAVKEIGYGLSGHGGGIKIGYKKSNPVDLENGCIGHYAKEGRCRKFDECEKRSVCIGIIAKQRPSWGGFKI